MILNHHAQLPSLCSTARPSLCSARWIKECKCLRQLGTVRASPVSSAAPMVEEWKLMLDGEPNQGLRNICAELLVAEPSAVYHEPAEVKEIVRLLYQYTKLQRMYSSSPLLLPHTNLLDVHKRYAPGTLSKLLHKLDAEVKAALTSVQGADLLVAVAPCIVPLLEAPPGALRRRADRLTELCPEFLPSSVFRAIPELLVTGWEQELTKESVARAGDVVVIGQGVRAVLLPSDQGVPGPLSSGPVGSRSSIDSVSSSAVVGGGQARRMRGDRANSGPSGSGGNHAATSLAQLSLPGSAVAIYAACRGSQGDSHPPAQGHAQQQQQQQQQQMQPRDREELIAVVPNSRCLMYLSQGDRALSERYADPYRDEEALMRIGAGKPGSWSKRSAGFFMEQPRMWLMWPSITTPPKP